MYQKIFKPVFDFTLALIAFVLFLPIMLLVMIGLRITGHKKIFFLQQRVGLHENIFHVFKFRTMTDKRDLQGNLLPDAERITSFGSFLRKTSLDELPQLLNVLRGEMSIIGPRPLLVQYLPLYSEEQRKRHLVKPGITGWSQVNGRNAISWKKKFELDVWYVENISLATDFRIILRTVSKVLGRSDISQAGEATVEAFNGHN